MAELRRDRIWDAGPHGCERSRQGSHHPLAQPQVARGPVRGRPRIRAQDAAVGKPLGELPEDALRIYRIGVLHRPILDDVPPTLDLGLDSLSPGTVVFALQVWNEQAESLG